MNFNNFDKQINIQQDGEGNVINNIFPSTTQYLKGNPFKPPQPREGGLFGREKELEKLHELLQSGKNVCVVSGMGGIGKTGLVREYANLPECISLFTGGVYYIDVRDRENMAGEIIALTKWRFKADLPANLSTQQMVTACWQQWKYQTENVLLIFDDVSSLNKDIESYLPPKDLVSLRVLMTSRETPDKRIAEKLELEVLSEAAAVDLLAAIIGQKRINAEPEEAKLLCYELGYLPLALELVGYYLDDEDYQDLSLLAMRGKLQEKIKHSALSPEQVPAGMQAKRGLQAAFDLSWEELKSEAKHLACVLAAFAPYPIRWDLVIKIYQQLQGESFNHDNLKDRWLKSLRKLHLVITVDKDIYNLHLLIHDYFYEQLKQHLNFSQIKQVFCDVFALVASSINPPINLITFNLIEPHLEKTIAWWENKASIKFAVSLNGLAWLYHSQGKYNKAEPLYLWSLEIKKCQLGKEHLDVAKILNELGLMYACQKLYTKAEFLICQSLEIRKRQLGTDNLDVAQSLNNLALLYHCQGLYNYAKPLYLKALNIRKRQLGNDHSDVAQSLHNLALFYKDQGQYNKDQEQYNKAKLYYLQSLRIRKSQLGVEHSDVAQSYYNFAFLYEAQNKYKKAKKLFNKALAIYKKELGNEHPNTQNAAVMVKVLYIMELLQCNKDTLFSILEALAKQANLPELNTETALTFLEQIENNPELLSFIRESLQQQT
ncbi:tetratricopeptide repeat protein [Dolichospermum circinale CS-534/05]|nr:tetratricopeptide repeat protein [Dolichospermum circinale]MDB9454006.1 tetratricopeptide repeat protein [Dolichospermum circinale CS-541/06]MDB9463181.1 tetratricopeptide repeat protein [Dolichospermum circinale CS-541/04]MDB9491245.1 tetratricopeptide repeat protein [Dolichospermum circinale CS-534/05]MDB9548986.1 tetratricopeptide repeat protein [Dolichospermum circinale CS-1031]